MNMKVKFILTYVAGIVTGILLLFVVGFFMAKSQYRFINRSARRLFVVGFFMAKSQATSASNDDVVMFEKPHGILLK